MFDTKLPCKSSLCILLGVAGACDAELAVAEIDAIESEAEADSESESEAADAAIDGAEALRAQPGGAAAGVTVNAIDFMRNTSSRKRLLLDAGQSYQPGDNKCTPEVSYNEQMNVKVGDFTHNIIRYVKSPDGKLWEQYNSNASKIWLERDTSWPAKDAGGKAGAGYDAKPFGSMTWAANNWTEGSQLPYSTRIVGFYWDQALPNACRYDATPTETYDVTGYKTFSYHPAKNWGGNVGVADSIAVDYYLPTWVNNATVQRLGERHWYARGQGWVGWEHFERTTNTLAQKCVWNLDGGPPTAPQIHCNGIMGDRALAFLGTSTQMTYNYGDWDYCHYKASCSTGQGLQGMSRAVTGAGPQRTAVCAQAGADYFGAHRATLQATGDQRRAQRRVNNNPDWDNGYWKLECGTDEYVAGVSQGSQVCSTGEGNFHGVVCAAGKASSLTQTCNTRVFNGSDSRATQSSGDWDPGAFKVECGTRQYVAGVSVDMTTLKAHALLCCNRG